VGWHQQCEAAQRCCDVAALQSGSKMVARWCGGVTIVGWWRDGVVVLQSSVAALQGGSVARQRRKAAVGQRHSEVVVVLAQLQGIRSAKWL
jgi:hypothetical protein